MHRPILSTVVVIALLASLSAICADPPAKEKPPEAEGPKKKRTKKKEG